MRLMMTIAKQSEQLRGARSTFRRTVVVCLILLAALLIAIFVSLNIGAERFPISSSLCVLFSGGSASCGLTTQQSDILFDILFDVRLPRILLAASVGASLATAGAGYQALLRNPLAEPYLLGISNGAAVGTMVSLVFFGTGQSAEWLRPVM